MIVIFVTVLSVPIDSEHQDCTVFTFSLNACLSPVNEHHGHYGLENHTEHIWGRCTAILFTHCKHSNKICTLRFNNLGCCVLHVLFSKHCSQVFCTATSYPGHPTFKCWHETQTNGILPKVRLLLLPSVSFPNSSNNPTIQHHIFWDTGSAQ
jgi:hypothetical protein